MSNKSLDFVAFLNAAAPARPTRREVLGAVSYEQRRDRAAAYLADMPAEELKAESNEFKHTLLTYLNHEPRPGDRQGLSKLYRSFTLDTGFADDERAKLDGLVEVLRQDEVLAKAKAKWSGLAPEVRVRVMQRVADAHSKHFGLQPVKVGLFQGEPDANGRMRNGYYDRAAGDIKLNSHPAAKLSRFGDALNLIIHENSHSHQVQMARQFTQGSIPKGDPRHAQVRIFKENLKDGSYIASQLDHATYKAQPLEAHANAAGAYVARKFLEPQLSPAMLKRAGAAQTGGMSMNASAAAIRKAQAEGKEVVFHLEM